MMLFRRSLKSTRSVSSRTQLASTISEMSLVYGRSYTISNVCMCFQD